MSWLARSESDVGGERLHLTAGLGTLQLGWRGVRRTSKIRGITTASAQAAVFGDHQRFPLWTV